MTRDEMVERMIKDDIQAIRDIWVADYNDVEFLYSVLSGEGWVPYNQLTDEQVVEEYENREADMNDREGIE